MINDKAFIVSRNPSCTPKLLATKTPLAIEHMAAYYRERERMIDYYIRVLKEAYAKYGYDDPFTRYGAFDERFINADFSTSSMQQKMGIVHSYAAKWNSWVKEGIRDFTFKRSQSYFVKKVNRNGKEYLDKDYHIEINYKNYFYFLALDEKIYEMYNYNKKYIKKYNSKLRHRDLIFDYVETVLKVKNDKNYEKDIKYVTLGELENMGYDELSDGYEVDNFLGPKGPGR